MTRQEVLKLARTALGVQLDALLGKAGHLRNDDRRRYAENGIKAIDEALAQPEHEPVAVKQMMRWVDGLKQQSDNGTHMNIPSGLSANACWELAIELEQFINTPPQREPLAQKQVDLILAKHELNFVRGKDRDDLLGAIRDIEAAHGIKGAA